MVNRPKIIVHIATSADGYIARPDGDLEWLTSQPAPDGFYGMPEFMKSVGPQILGRKTFEASVLLGAKFERGSQYVVFSRQPKPTSAPPTVEFTSEPVSVVAQRLRKNATKDIWLMGGGELIAAFLDASAIDEFVVTVMPVFIGSGVPLIAPSRKDVALELLSSKAFENGVVQLHYRIRNGTQAT
jgi:dihydrofolate reductase